MAVREEKNKNKLPKDGRSWYYDTYYTNVYGERKEKKSKYYRTRKQAQEAERDFLNKIDVKNFDNKNILFKEVYDEWLNYKKELVKVSSIYNIRKTLNKHLKEFMECELHSITYQRLYDWKNKLHNECNISISQQNKVIGYFGEILNYAKDNYNYDYNIVKRLTKYRDDEITERTESEYNFWSYDEFKQFIKVVDNEFYKLVFSFLYFTGLRIGEMVALTWNDIDFSKKTLSVTKSFTCNVEDKVYMITTPKTKNSIRIIELSDNIISLLKRHYESESKIYHFDKSMFIFGNVSYVAQTTLRRKLKEYINKANVKKIKLHGFRHSHVSLLIHLGCDSRDVAERIGDTVQIVESTYYHMFPEKKTSTVNALNKLE